MTPRRLPLWAGFSRDPDGCCRGKLFDRPSQDQALGHLSPLSILADFRRCDRLVHQVFPARGPPVSLGQGAKYPMLQKLGPIHTGGLCPEPNRSIPLKCEVISGFLVRPKPQPEALRGRSFTKPVQHVEDLPPADQERHPDLRQCDPQVGQRLGNTVPMARGKILSARHRRFDSITAHHRTALGQRRLEGGMVRNP